MEQKGRKIPIVPEKPARERFVHHPLFNEKLADAMDGVVFPVEEIPKEFHHWLDLSLVHISFPALKCPYPIYDEITSIHPSQMPFGVLQKCCDIIFNSRPVDLFANVGASEAITRHKEVLIIVSGMIDRQRDIIEPIREKVIDELIDIEEKNNIGKKLMM